MAGVGAQLFQPPVTLVNTMNGWTQKYFQPILADSIFRPSPTYWRITRLGKKIDGGGGLVWSVITTEETTGGSYYGVQVLDTSITDSAVPAELNWKFYQQAISIPVTDLLMNAGRGNVIDLVKGKEEIAMGSLLQKLARAIYGVSPQNTSTDIDSLPSALAASGSYANITLSATTGWLSNGTLGPAVGAGTNNIGLATMQTDYGNATFGNEEPDTAIMTQTGFNAFWALLTVNQRYFDEETTRAGFKNHLMFNNAVVLHDQFTPSGEMYFLTSKYIKPIFMEQDYFRVDPFLQPTNQRVMISHIWLALNVQLLTLRQHSRRTTLTNG